MIVGRESQYSSLVAALESNLPQSLLIWGPPSSGKTLVFERALRKCKIRQLARISAIEVMCGRRPFFETLLKQLLVKSKNDAGEEEEQVVSMKCENLRAFVYQLRQILCQHYDETTSGKTVIIIEQADYLRDEHAEILEVFSRLQELVQSNLCVVIFSSVIPSMGFTSICNMRSIPSIQFPQYSKEEVLNIIVTSHRPQNADAELFSAYVGMVIDVFFQCCRDLKKLLRLTLSNWDSIQIQHANQNNNPNSIHKVWKNVVPQLRQDFKALNSQFLPMMIAGGDKDKDKDKDKSERKKRKISTEASASATSTSSTHSSSFVVEGRNNQTTKKLASSSSTTETTLKVKTKERSYDDIPKYSRYILIASYLATHNPPASDKRFFVKGATRKTGGKRSNKLNIRAQLEENENSNERTKALRSFEQNRLKSIFAFLVSYCSGGEAYYEGNVDWFMQISSLCQSQFIQRLGEDTSGNMKYRCLADYDFILAVAKSVDFELDKHLYRLL